MSKIALFFSGIGYTCDRPLLYYAKRLAEQEGYECRAVPYAYEGDLNIRGDRQKMEGAFRALFAQAREFLAGTELKGYEELLFVSKSVGTVIAAAYARELIGPADVSGRGEEAADLRDKLRHVFYTPLEYTFGYAPENAVGFLGTADPWCVPDEVIRIAKERGTPMHVYDGANHSLETGNALADLEILKDVMAKTKSFLRRA